MMSKYTCSPGKTVFFCSTAKCVHLHPLDVRGCLDVVWVRNQVWETCRTKSNVNTSIVLERHDLSKTSVIAGRSSVIVSINLNMHRTREYYAELLQSSQT